MRIRFAVFCSCLALGAGAALGATTVTVTDVATSRGPSIRIAHFLPDAPSATLVVLTGGDGVLALDERGVGSTANFRESPPVRNRERFLDRGISVVLVDAPADMIPAGMDLDYRATPAHATELRAVLAAVRARDNTPMWVLGYSAGGISATNLAIADAARAFGLVLLAPVTQGVGSILDMPLETLRRPTLLATHDLDPCPPTPPANAPRVLERLSATEARHHVRFSGGNAGAQVIACDRLGHHGVAGLDAELVDAVAEWMSLHASRVQLPNFQGLWWGAPPGSEPGWGVNLTQQGEILFATWFTYDPEGSPLWLVMSEGVRIGEHRYAGTLYRTTGPPFDSQPFPPSAVVAQPVGSATFSFTDSHNGTFAYLVNGVSQEKRIARQVYAAPVPACFAGAAHGAAPNYQALWWATPAGSESGWGLNIAHQGDVLFATWFTYAADGRGTWLVVSDGRRTAPGTYAGTLYRTTGPVFSTPAWPATPAPPVAVGTATFTFTDAENGTFAYTVGAVSQVKRIGRQAYASPVTACR